MDSINEVIDALDKIIQEAQKTQSPAGYFAALYQKVTIKVKEGIEADFFEDGARMETLDIAFAKRYLDAYAQYHSNQNTTASWQRAFESTKDNSLIVLQHLLLGMNAHINLDLGIAAAQVQKNKKMEDLKTDFNKINQILSSLVFQVQNDLTYIWPPLKFILKRTGKLDDLLVDFSMEIARDGAWEFAQAIHKEPETNHRLLIDERDQKIVRKGDFIVQRKGIGKFILWMIRTGEKGTVADRINRLKN